MATLFRVTGEQVSAALRLPDLKSALELAYTRRRHVTVTQAGLDMLDHEHQWQEEVFDHLTTGWTIRQRTTFHQAMQSLLNRSHTLPL
ncbi:hypothetical protein AB0H36_09250 [Kribbella sp. NPDC050820]|uniref:hypothetical protein n=1 Tax=Kribbella sp. NPDC050820 TaxID=3155408 RepID=UPI0034111FF6